MTKSRRLHQALRALGALQTGLAAPLMVVACLVSPLGIAQTPAAPEEAPAPAPIEEVVVTGSRIAAPNLTSTSPITVVDQKAIQTTGRSDMSDLIMMLPQNFDNGLGQDLGNSTSGLTTAGGVATADLRGLGPNRTLVLVDGVRLGIGSPYTFIQQPAPDLDQIPDVSGRPRRGRDRRRLRDLRIRRHRRRHQLHHEEEFRGRPGRWPAGRDNWHDNHDTFWQQQNAAVRQHCRTNRRRLGRHNRQFDMIVGTNFADGKGNVTALLQLLPYRPGSRCRARLEQLSGESEVTDDSGNVVGQTCGGSSNSNWFQPFTGPNANTPNDRSACSARASFRWDRGDDPAGLFQLAAVHLHDARGHALPRRGSWRTTM